MGATPAAESGIVLEKSVEETDPTVEVAPSGDVTGAVGADNVPVGVVVLLTV